MSAVRSIFLMLAMLLQALPAQLVALPAGSGEPCERGCCSEKASQEDHGCGCAMAPDSSRNGEPSLPELPSRSERQFMVMASLAEGEATVWSALPLTASSPRHVPGEDRAHLPEVRLAVLFCSFLN